jgi:Fur family ferric uptake transcriptional regulator
MHHTQLVEDLRRNGYRLTPQREAILEILCTTDGHLSADEIIARVRKRYPYLNKSAVYRTLDLLVQLGWVNPTDLGGGCMTYEWHRDPHHHHLICHQCGKTTRIGAEVFASVEKTLREQYGFTPCLDHFAIFGLCRKCASKSKRQQRV